MKYALPERSASRGRAPHVSCLRVAVVLASLAALHPWLHAATDPQVSRLYEDALSRYEKKDIPGAIIQLKNALTIDSKNLSVQALLGRALLANKEVIAAEVALDEALRLGVNRAEVVVPLAQALQGQGKPQPLLDQPRFDVTGLPPGVKSQLLLIKANAASDTGDARLAMKLIEEARVLEPANAESWLAEVPIRLRANQFREATTSADRALALAPNSPQALYLRGTVSHVQADRNGTLALYDRALKANPSHTETLVARAGILMDLNRITDAARDVAELRKSSPDDPRGAYLAALIAEQEKRPADAKAALNQVTALLDPVPLPFIRYRSQLLILGGLAHYGLNQREKAKPYLEAALRSQPNTPVSKLLAQIYLGEKNVDRAIEALDSYLKGHPNDVQATQLLASAHMSQGRHARATSLLQAAVKKQDQPAMRGMLGLSMFNAGKYASAVPELEDAVKRDPGQVQAGSALMALYMQSGQAAKAVAVGDTLVKHQPSHAGLHNLLGTARARSGDLPGARASFEQAIKLDAKFMAPQIHIARLDSNAKVYDAAIARLDAVLAKDGKNVDALIELGRVQQRLGKQAEAQRSLEKADDVSGPDNITAGLALVDFHLVNRRPDMAVEACKRLVNKAPESTAVLVTVARANLAAGDNAVAKAALSRASGVASYDAPLLVEIALLQQRAGHLPGAAQSLDKALAEQPDYIPAMALLADVEVRQGELAKAEVRARRMIVLQPKQGIGHALLGDIATARNQRPAAIEAYRKAHALDQSSDSLIRLHRAMAAADPVAAAKLAEQWVKSKPRDMAVRRALADSQALAGNFAAARLSYEEVAKASPDDAMVLNNLANLQILLNDPKALATAERALARSPNAPNILATAGWAAFKAGQADRSLQLLRDARLRDPGSPDTRYFLGAVLASAGRNAEAREELQTALRSDRKFNSSKDAEKLLQTLK